MAGKRKAKPQDAMRPSKWRLQHGGLAEAIREADPETRCAHAKARKATHECIAPSNLRGVDSRHAEKPRQRGHRDVEAMVPSGRCRMRGASARKVASGRP
jgi:hypothetical protein